MILYGKSRNVNVEKAHFFVYSKRVYLSNGISEEDIYRQINKSIEAILGVKMIE